MHSGRKDILVDTEEVCRIELLLERHQPLIARTIGEGGAVGFISGQKVDVGTSTGIRL